MANHFTFSIALCVSLCHFFCPVQTADECQTNADCKNSWSSTNVCCGGWFGEKQRSCIYADSCLNTYCSTDSDCGDASLCCRSNKCVKNGCSGCTDDGNCATGHVCCKKTFPLNETLCSSNCINQPCNHNEDCAGYSECCRSGKCVTTGCDDKCTSKSDCDLGEYCCKKKAKDDIWFSGADCSISCIGEHCGSDEDCGGPNECCISNKCVTEGCHGCNSSADCGSEHYCCKKKEWYELNECSADCLGKSCGTDSDCGGPQERCDSENRCLPKTSLPSWAIPVIVASLVVFLIPVGAFVALFWYFSKVRRQNRIETGRGTVALQNTQRRAENEQPLLQFPHSNNQTAPEPHNSGNNRPHEFYNPSYYHQEQPTTAQTAQYQDVVGQNPSVKTWNRGIENPELYNGPENNQNQPAMIPNFNQAQSINNPVTTDTPNHGIQYYPQNTPYQQGDRGFNNPPYNPQYPGNP